MAGTALGLIETKGLVAAIEALDASLKAAQVRLADMDLVSGGLVTIRFTGDTGAVRAAVSAGACAARRVGTLVAFHVIPRPHAEIADIAYGPGVRRRPRGPSDPGGHGGSKPPQDGGPAPDESAPHGPAPGEPVPGGLAPSEPASAQPAPAQPRWADITDRLREILKGTEVEDMLEDVATVSDLPVWKLRRIARHVPGIGMAGVEISNARKEQLLNEMTRAVLDGGDGP